MGLPDSFLRSIFPCVLYSLYYRHTSFLSTRIRISLYRKLPFLRRWIFFTQYWRRQFFLCFGFLMDFSSLNVSGQSVVLLKGPSATGELTSNQLVEIVFPNATSVRWVDRTHRSSEGAELGAQHNVSTHARPCCFSTIGVGWKYSVQVEMIPAGTIKP